MTEYQHGDIAWWRSARFGLFLHWGLYALPARGEWVQTTEQLSTAAYRRYFDHFDPDLFQPAEWARTARRAGMKYFVITTKHFEGFALWDTAQSDFKATNTACGKDLLRETVDAFRQEGLRVGFYYPLVDWHHPDFKLDELHPLRHDPAEQARAAGRDMKRYAAFMRNQITELLTGYGPIDILWLDHAYLPDHMGTTPEEWEAAELLTLIRRLQPQILLNDRLMLPGGADFCCPEQYVPVEGMRDRDGHLLDWEGCQTMASSWGYHRDDSQWKSPYLLLSTLVKQVSRGGNLLMNAGPSGRGVLDDRVLQSLRVYADWMKFHSRSIYDCGMAPQGMEEPGGCRFTWNASTRRLYVHLLEWPLGTLVVRRLAGKVRYAQFLHDAGEVIFRNGSRNAAGHVGKDSFPEDSVVFQLPVVKPPFEIPVLELFLD